MSVFRLNIFSRYYRSGIKHLRPDSKIHMHTIWEFANIYKIYMNLWPKGKLQWIMWVFVGMGRVENRVKGQIWYVQCSLFFAMLKSSVATRRQYLIRNQRAVTIQFFANKNRYFPNNIHPVISSIHKLSFTSDINFVFIFISFVWCP